MVAACTAARRTRLRPSAGWYVRCTRMPSECCREHPSKRQVDDPHMITVCALLFPFGGACGDREAEEPEAEQSVGKELEEAGEDTSEAIEEAAEDTDEAVDEAAEDE